MVWCKVSFLSMAVEVSKWSFTARVSAFDLWDVLSIPNVHLYFQLTNWMMKSSSPGHRQSRPFEPRRLWLWCRCILYLQMTTNSSKLVHCAKFQRNAGNFFYGICRTTTFWEHRCFIVVSCQDHVCFSRRINLVCHDGPLCDQTFRCCEFVTANSTGCPHRHHCIQRLSSFQRY